MNLRETMNNGTMPESAQQGREVGLQTMMGRARACFSRKAFAEAEELYREVLDGNPSHVDTLTNLGSVLLLQKKLTEAEKTYRKALDLRPGYAPAGFGLAKAHLAGKRFDKALEELQRLNKGGSIEKEFRAEFYKLIGIIYHARKDWDVAVTFFEKYAAECPDHADPLDCLYNVHASAGDEEAVQQVLEKISSRFPERMDTKITLVRRLRGKGAFRQMSQIFDQMIEGVPEDASIYNLIVHLCLAEKKYAHARLYFERARKILPNVEIDKHPALKLAESLG